MVNVSIDLRKLVVRNVNEGLSKRTIAKHLNSSRCALLNIIKKVKEHRTIENLPKNSRPRMNSERTVRSLIPDAKINPKKTAAELLKDWKSSFSTSISTVKRVKRKHNLFGRISEKNHY